jgi:hypothetical protein
LPLSKMELSNVNILLNNLSLRDNGGRRSGIDLRQFSYTDHIPERRGGQERRSNLDRRNGENRRVLEDRRSSSDTQKEHEEVSNVIEMRRFNRRNCTERRAAFG